MTNTLYKYLYIILNVTESDNNDIASVERGRGAENESRTLNRDLTWLYTK